MGGEQLSGRLCLWQEERRRIERQNEEAFREMLKEKAKAGEVTLESRWRVRRQ